MLLLKLKLLLLFLFLELLLLLLLFLLALAESFACTVASPSSLQLHAGGISLALRVNEYVKFKEH